jgi:hypothetical protein
VTLLSDGRYLFTRLAGHHLSPRLRYLREVLEGKDVAPPATPEPNKTPGAPPEATMPSDMVDFLTLRATANGRSIRWAAADSIRSAMNAEAVAKQDATPPPEPAPSIDAVRARFNAMLYASLDAGTPVTARKTDGGGYALLFDDGTEVVIRASVVGKVSS